MWEATYLLEKILYLLGEDNRFRKDGSVTCARVKINFYSVGYACSKIGSICAWHHNIMIAVYNEYWVLNVRQILWRLFTPSINCTELAQERRNTDRSIWMGKT